MIVTGVKFAIIGEALFGSRYKRALALALCKSEETVHGYAAGRTNVSRAVRMKLAILCFTRGAALMRLATELDPQVAKIADLSVIDDS